MAQAATAKTLAANQRITAGALLQQSQAELGTDPLSSVKDALASTKTHRRRARKTSFGARCSRTMTSRNSRPAALRKEPRIRPMRRRSQWRTGQASCRSRGRRWPPARELHDASPLNDVVWSPDGLTVAAGAKDGKCACGTRSKAPIHTLGAGRACRRCRVLAGRPDARDRRGSDSEALGRRERRLGQDARTCAPVARRIVQFGGRLLLTVSNDKAAYVWDVATGTLLSTLPHKQEVTAAAFGPGGNLVVTGSRDDTAKIWDARTGALEGTLRGTPRRSSRLRSVRSATRSRLGVSTAPYASGAQARFLSSMCAFFPGRSSRSGSPRMGRASRRPTPQGGR